MRVFSLALAIALLGCGSESKESSGSDAATSYPLSNSRWSYAISAGCSHLFIFQDTTFSQMIFCLDIQSTPETIYIEETTGSFSDTGSKISFKPDKSTCPSYSDVSYDYDFRNGGRNLKVDIGNGSITFNKVDTSGSSGEESETDYRYIYGCFDSEGNFTPES